MDKSLVSIIIPIYDVEKYIYRCIDSILNQTYRNLEIILVDDESPDNCPDICDKYANIDSRVKVVHKKNGGLSDARNVGIMFATGEFIVFVDSDDYVEPNMVELAIRAVISNDADIIIWGFYVDFVDKEEKLIKSLTSSCPAGFYHRDNLKSLEINDGLLGSLGYAWNKMYKTKLIKMNNSQFIKGLSLVEDIIYNSLLLAASASIAFISDPLYHYMQRFRSTLGTMFYADHYELKLKAINAIKDLLMSWHINSNIIKKVICLRSFDSLKSTVKLYSITNNCSYINKIEYLYCLLNKTEVQNVLYSVNVSSFKDKIIKKMMQLKQYDLLIFSYKLAFKIECRRSKNV